jgi:hypothetical protein
MRGAIVTEDDARIVWCDVEAAARILGVSGRSIRRACKRGKLRRWRRIGCGASRSRRYQVILAEVRQLLVSESDNSDNSDNSIAS